MSKPIVDPQALINNAALRDLVNALASEFCSHAYRRQLVEMSVSDCEYLAYRRYFRWAPDKSRINWVMAEVILVIMVLYVTMVYGPIAAFLVELFPVRIRYTSMSLPYHIGNGWFGGLLPATSFAMVASTGDIYFGLWYPIGFALMTVVIGILFVRDPGEKNIDHVR